MRGCNKDWGFCLTRCFPFHLHLESHHEERPTGQAGEGGLDHPPSNTNTKSHPACSQHLFCASKEKPLTDFLALTSNRAPRRCSAENAGLKGRKGRGHHLSWWKIRQCTAPCETLLTGTLLLMALYPNTIGRGVISRFSVTIYVTDTVFNIRF